MVLKHSYSLINSSSLAIFTRFFLGFKVSRADLFVSMKE